MPPHAHLTITPAPTLSQTAGDLTGLRLWVVMGRMKALAKRAARSLGYDIVKYRSWEDDKSPLRDEFKHIEFAGEALQKLIDQYQFETVLDIGCGAGEHTESFLRHGKKVTALDYGHGRFFDKNKGRAQCLIGDFNQMRFEQQFDCVWASHVLEHQLNVGVFLRKLFEATNEGGVVCITVPPYQPEILRAHVTWWNAGMVLYNLVFAGFDCSTPAIKAYGYNISVILRKRSIPQQIPDSAWPSQYLPVELTEGANGNILLLNW